jgi:activating signal cointegrator complex subunit 2
MLILYFLNSGDVEYDDEYDDTYDTNAMGENEPDAMDLREFVLPRALGGGHVTGSRQKGRGNAGSEEESDEDGDKPVRSEFVRNPEEIRQAAAERRQTKMDRNDKKPYVHKIKDVVGNAKGQGQDKQVLINRARKNANKNKGHRVGADKKQSKGMF